MKKYAAFIIMVLLICACGGRNQKAAESGLADLDDGKGIGEIKQVELNELLDPEMVARGRKIYEAKCSTCHKLNSQRLAGPGWKRITERRKPEWIMNMVTNVEVMLAEDATAQELLDDCLLHMPDQELTPTEARDVLEFMLMNDGRAVGE